MHKAANIMYNKKQRIKKLRRKTYTITWNITMNSKTLLQMHCDSKVFPTTTNITDNVCLRCCHQMVTAGIHRPIHLTNTEQQRALDDFSPQACIWAVSVNTHHCHSIISQPKSCHFTIVQRVGCRDNLRTVARLCSLRSRLYNHSGSCDKHTIVHSRICFSDDTHRSWANFS